MAGPVLIFDKSLLQSLNLDEAALLDNSYLSNITPLFFVETLADLEKKVREGNTPEQVVRSLVRKTKTPEMGRPNAHHRTLLEGELAGKVNIDMTYGRPHISGGRTYELGGKTGTYFEQSPEEDAF